MHPVILCVFSLALSICVWPIFLRVPIEISPVFGGVEADMFAWYRMWLIVGAGTIFFFQKQKLSKSILVFLSLVTISTIHSEYFRTSLFGSPWTHEGLLVLLAYIPLYYTAKKYGLFKGLERCIDTAIVIVGTLGIIQIVDGNFLAFRILKSLLPGETLNMTHWPMWSTLGNGNNLGLFCALVFPYAAFKKKYLLTGLIVFMALCSATRSAWLSIVITACFITRPVKVVAIAVLLALMPLPPIYENSIPRIARALSEIHIPPHDGDFSGRAFIWKESIPQLKETLLLGHGPGTFGLYFPQQTPRGTAIGFSTDQGGLLVKIDRPHNMFLNTWITTGLPSLLILLFMFARIIIPAKDRALQLSCVGFLVTGLFTDSVLSVTPYFIIFLGGLAHANDEERRNGKGTPGTNHASGVHGPSHTTAFSFDPACSGKTYVPATGNSKGDSAVQT